MHIRGLAVIFAFVGLVTVGCGWSPPSAPPPAEDTCAPTDGPTEDTVAKAIADLASAPGNVPWTQARSGHTTDCRLYWVHVSAGAGTAVPQQVLFFDRNTPVGTATSEPRPYTHVLNSGEDTVTVQYQWRQGNDAPCCPTGIAQVRYQLADDGSVKSLDPTPDE